MPRETVRGTVKWYNTTKGFGFIKPDDGSKDIFLHLSSLERSGLSTISEGTKIEYEIDIGRDGREAAGFIHLLDEPIEPIQKKRTFFVPKIPNQHSSTHFTIQDGLISSIPTQLLSEDENDYRKLSALQIPILEAIESAIASLSKGNKPFGLLLDSLQKYKTQIKGDVRSLNYATLYGYGLKLNSAFKATKKDIELGNLPEFDISALAESETVVQLHGPFILSSKDGRDFVSDSERYNMDQSELNILHDNIKDFINIINDEGNIFQKETRETIEYYLPIETESDNKSRQFLFSKNTIKNLIIVLAAGAVIGSASLVPIIGPFVAASLGLVGIEALKKSDVFQKTISPIKDAFDNTSSIDISQISNNNFERFRNFVYKNRELLKSIGGNSSEMKWFRDVVSWIENPKTKDISKEDIIIDKEK